MIRYAGGSPPAVLSGWKDTIFIAPSESVELRMRFTDFADSTSPYMFHCHLLRQEDDGLMGQFVVARPGEKVGAIQVPDHVAHAAEPQIADTHGRHGD